MATTVRSLMVALLALVWSSLAEAQEYETDRPGGDYKVLRLRAADFNVCRQACADDDQCAAWTYRSPESTGGRARCVLKSVVSKRVSDDCCISGVKETASVDSEDRCRDYATKAVSQNDENLRKRCGFTGERWQSSRRAHFEACMDLTPKQARAEQQFRDGKLAECAAGGDDADDDETECRDYAEKAATAAKEAEKLGCGYSGERWTRIYTRHYNWCRLASRSQRGVEEKARLKELAQCRDDQEGDGKDERCQTYAEEAVQQNAENRKLKCELTGKRWQSKLGPHIAFCESASREQLRSEQAARREALRQCRENASDGAADKAEACRDYADAAAGQQLENRKRGCGFKGDQWRSSTAFHYEWCMQNTRADREEQFALRTRDLKRCRAEESGGDGPDCGDYAEKALAAAGDNRKLGCGFTGERWSTDDRLHQRFCEKAPSRASAKEAKLREDLIGVCRADPGRARECREYSNLAIEHHRVNLTKGCGFTGPRWNTAYEEHFVYCMGVKRSARRIETIARTAALLSCQ